MLDRLKGGLLRYPRARLELRLVAALTARTRPAASWSSICISAASNWHR